MIPNDLVLPPSYEPAKQIILCSNVLTGVTIPFEVQGHAPLLISDKRGLEVWLEAWTQSGDWVPVVQQNRSIQKSVVVKHIKGQSLTVLALSTIVLTVSMQASGLSVTQLDMRPLGLDIHGDANALWVAGGKFSKNTMLGGRSFLAMS